MRSECRRNKTKQSQAKLSWAHFILQTNPDAHKKYEQIDCAHSGTYHVNHAVVFASPSPPPPDRCFDLDIERKESNHKQLSIIFQSFDAAMFIGRINDLIMWTRCLKQKERGGELEHIFE